MDEKLLFIAKKKLIYGVISAINAVRPFEVQITDETITHRHGNENKITDGQRYQFLCDMEKEGLIVRRYAGSWSAKRK